ncbi:amino acid adenylation domain-containing protein [Salipiger bermudensis]|uniref:non-ribosomal peptide synthetase n=1 Tax=Salipiger bermudensis TaxID=344736 RepID=UPI001C99FD86|nr:non-ribosomal peptide synthetase [Salipiger bermudensis]MBY6006066.1 amino acid adenylation domain-containing protein [Salipiger bermudensis]
MELAEWRPLTEAQAGIWYAQARDPQSPVFVTGQALYIDGPLEAAALSRAVARLGGEAESLSLRLRAGPTGPEQRIVPGSAPGLVVRAREGVGLAEVEAEILAEAQRPMDLERGPVAGFTLWRLAPARHILTERIHHIAADGQAMVQVTQRLAALYAAELSGGDAGEGLAHYARALEEEARFGTAAARARQRAFWHARLADLPEVESVSRGRADGDGHWFHRAERPLPGATGQALARLSDRTGLHWTDVLTALAGAYVGRHLPSVASGESRDVVLGIPLQNRMGRTARCVSTQVNVLPLQLRLDEGAPLPDWLQTVGADLAGMRRNARYRGEALQRELGRIGAGRRLWGPLVNILPFEACPEIAGCETRLKILGAGSVDDLTLCFRGDPEAGLLAQVDGNTALYSEAETEAHCARLEAFLTAALLAERLRDVPTLTKAETRAHLETRNATAREVPRTTLTALIEAQMAASPAAPALVFGETCLSYGELDRQSAALARRLAGRGIGPGALVGLALPRSLDLLVALIGTLRAGAAFLPLDPEDGSARRADMIARAAPAVILATPGFACEGAPVLGVLDDGQEAEPSPAGPEDPAYVLFTSGSTGRPKGVVVAHDAIVNRLLWMRETYGFGPGDRILQKTPTSFDVSVWELVLPFLSGATLVVAPPGAQRDPVALAGLVRTQRITAMHFVPSMLELFLDAPASQGLAIARVFASGEALPQRLAERFHRRITGRLFNLYGPTEAAIDVTAQEALAGQGGEAVPIGRPVWNTRTYLLDAALRPVPDGVPGRLYLAGRQLAQGYLGQPELTAERFPPDPFRPGGRIYDTGDLAVSDARGVMTFVGRADQQVKIRGVRVEPAEVERALFGTGMVAQGVVIVEAAPGGARLLAYVVPEPGATAEAIRAALAGQLPVAMLPAQVITLDALPLTPSGKLDRKALPAAEGQGGAGRAPESPTERMLAALYSEILALPQPVDAETDFFLAGGDSLRAVALSLRIEEATGRDPGLGAILESPVLADLARRIERGAGGDDGTGPVLRLSGGEGLPVFAVHPAGGLCWCYRTLAQALPGRPVIGLQSPLLDAGSRAPVSVTEMARRYVGRIEAAQPEGPLTLLGWSLGGIIAHAIAAEAERRGREVARLVLLDAYPSECWRDEPEPDETAALRALLAIAGFDPEAHAGLDSRAAILDFLKAAGHPLGQVPRAVQDGVIRSVQATNALVRGHREPRVRAPLLHVGALRDQAGTNRSAALWQPFAGDVESLPLDCHHPDLIAREIVAAYLPALSDAVEPVLARPEGAA